MVSVALYTVYFASFCNTAIFFIFFGRPFVKRFALYYRTVVCLNVCLSCPVCNVGVLWPNDWTDQDETWHAGRPRPWPHSDSGPLPPQAHSHPSPIFGPYLLWRNSSIDQDTTWHGGRPRPKRHCVRWDLAPSPKRGQSPLQFSAHVYCGQTATWIKMPLGWWRGVVVSVVRRMNEVTLPRARLVLGWVTVFGLSSRCVKGQLSLASLLGR